MYLVSTLTGSLLVHPTYFNGPSATRHGWNNVTVTTVRVLGGLLPAVVCAWSGGPPNCTNLYEIEDIRWIILFGIQVGQRTAYALTLAFSLVVLLLHIIFSLDAVSKAVQHFMDGISCPYCRIILGHQSKRMNNLVFVAFVIYWLEVVIGIELSLIVNFGPDVRTQNNWGFGQVRVVHFDLTAATDYLFADPVICPPVSYFRSSLVERYVPDVGFHQARIQYRCRCNRFTHVNQMAAALLSIEHAFQCIRTLLSPSLFSLVQFR